MDALAPFLGASMDLDDLYHTLHGSADLEGAGEVLGQARDARGKEALEPRASLRSHGPPRPQP